MHLLNTECLQPLTVFVEYLGFESVVAFFVEEVNELFWCLSCAAFAAFGFICIETGGQRCCWWDSGHSFGDHQRIVVGIDNGFFALAQEQRTAVVAAWYVDTATNMLACWVLLCLFKFLKLARKNSCWL